MNFLNKGFLRLALLPAPLYSRMGVDISQLRNILRVKLTMDDRRPGTLQQTRASKSNKPVTMATVGTMMMSALMGIFYLLAFFIGQDIITRLSLYFSLFFFMLSASLISDFTSVLIDVRDNYIILPRPVSDRTFIVARFLHIFIHICKLVLPMSLPGLIFMWVNYGFAGGLLFLFIVFLVTLFSIFFINAVYIVILRITTPQKFQSIISYFQIVFAIVIYGSYQIFPRMLHEMNIRSFDISSQSWIIAYPIYWFACLWKLLYTWNLNARELAAALAGFVLPFVSLWIVIRYLAPSFNNKLALITSSSGATESVKTKNKVLKKNSYAQLISRLFTRNYTERMGFLFTWKMTARSRDFRLKVYPSIGYILVYVAYMLLSKRDISLEDISENESRAKILIISALYFSSFILTMAINQINYSEKFKASWIYYVTPLQRPGEIISGSSKAIILKFYIPLVVFITASSIILIGPIVLPNIILGLFNELLIAALLVYVRHKMFPFSLQQNNDSRSGSFMRSLVILLISAFLALGHYLIYDFIYVVMICAVLSIVATWTIMSAIRNTSWESIRSSYAEKEN